jgi:outer membrane murein-binding lipoprotein Lpp
MLPDKKIIVFPLRVVATDSYSSGSGGNRGDNSMEARVARLEASVEHIESDISEIKSDIREIRAENKADFQYLNTRIDNLAAKIDTHIYWFVGIIIAIFISIGVSVFGLIK